MENRKFARYFFTLVAEPVEARSLSLWSDRLTNRAVAVAEFIFRQAHQPCGGDR